MRTIIKLSIVLLVSAFSTLSLAGSVYNTMRPRPMVRDMSGFYVGLGAGMNTAISHSSSYSVALAGVFEAVGTTNNLFPVAQVGYWGHADPTVLWGLKAFYKYLDSNIYYHATAGGGNVRIPHEVSLLLNVGMILRKCVPYFGLGAMWLPNVQDIFRSPSLGEQVNPSKSRIGAIVQLGFLYNVTSNWFVDTVYSYGFTGRSTYDGTSTGGTSISRKTRVTLQEVMMSVNRRF